MRLGLLQDDAEWHAAMNDAAHTAMSPQIRLLYIVLLEFCSPADPIALFEQHWLQMADDFDLLGSIQLLGLMSCVRWLRWT